MVRAQFITALDLNYLLIYSLNLRTAQNMHVAK